METQRKSFEELMFNAAFIVLSLLVWCPLGYGRYGEVGRWFGMPTWATMALLLGALLFVLEWIYLFKPGLALDDESLPRIMNELKTLDAELTKK